MSKKSTYNYFPTFYIITPSFNQAFFIKQTIKSVFSQRGNFHIKYLIMDGDSNDGTYEVLEKLPNFIYWQSKKDKGQTNALNKAIQVINTFDPKKDDIVAYCNSDDYYLPNAFQKVVNAFSLSSDSDWLVGDAKIVNESNTEIQQTVKKYKKSLRYLLKFNFFQWLLLVLNPIPQPSVFIKYSAIEKIGLFNENLHFTMDYEYWLRLQKNIGKPLIIEGSLSAFRIHSLSKGGSKFVEQFEEELNVAKAFTSNHFLIFLHSIHKKIIVFMYKKMKRFN